jgi:hypothetical protein
MRLVIRTLILVVATASIAFAQEANCSIDPARHTFNEWIKRVGLDYGKEYAVSPIRKKQITENFDKIKIGMTKSEVEKLLGSPDVEERFRTPKVTPQNNLDAKKRCGYRWVYLFSKTDVNLADMKDEAIFLSFDDAGKLTWVAPQNVKGLKEKGSPL